MLLTDREREFLAVFIREATTDPFHGPATDELHRRDIYYTDLSHLMTAYYQEDIGHPEGMRGTGSLTAPPCPWTNRDAALQRDRDVQSQLHRTAEQTAS